MAGIGREFMEKTKYQNLPESPQEQGLPQPPLQLPCPAEAVLIELPRVDQIRVKQVDLQTAIAKRRSLREFSRASLSLDELAYFL